MNLRHILSDHVNGNSIISIDTETTLKLRGGKKNLQQGRVTKRQIGSTVMIFQNKLSNGYDNMVKRRLEKEGKDPSSFELGPRTWGSRLPNLPIVEHNGQYYLEVIFLHPGEVKYYLDGKEVSKNTIQGLIESTSGDQGGLDNKVIIRTFKIDSITKMKIDHNIITNLTFS